MSKLLGKVTIDGMTWRVEESARIRHFGWCHWRDRRIVLKDRRLVTPRQFVGAVLHETAHAFAWQLSEAAICELERSQLDVLKAAGVAFHIAEEP